jgi:hypothetical protein
VGLAPLTQEETKSLTLSAPNQKPGARYNYEAASIHRVVYGCHAGLVAPAGWEETNV